MIEILEDRIKKTPEDFGFGDFLHTTQKSRFIKERTDKLDFTKIKNFFSVKDTVKRMKDKSYW